MGSRAFDWALVQSFLAVVDAGSLSGAARRLGANQPTLSRHIAELEGQLGVALFERTGRGLTPTRAALAILDGARAMDSAADRLGRALADSASATTGTVRLTTSHVAATWLLPPLLADLRAAQPGIAVELVASDRVTDLLRREADIAVRMVRPTQSSLVARRLGEVPIVAAAHRDYLARAGTPRVATDLLRHTLVGYDADTTILRGFAAAGFPLERQHFSLRTDDTIAYAALVAAGAGIGFLAGYSLRHLPGVVPIPLPARMPSLPVWLAVHREIRDSRLVRQVYAHLVHAIPRALGEVGKVPPRKPKG